MSLEIASWCNGSTPDFGSGSPRSNRGGATALKGGTHLYSFIYGGVTPWGVKPHSNPRGVMVATIDSKSIAVQGVPVRFRPGVQKTGLILGKINL